MEKFETGAVRSSRMPRYDLIPRCALERLAKRFTGEILSKIEIGTVVGCVESNNDLEIQYTGGALKYGECNWERGLPTSDVINHIYDYLTRYVDRFREELKISEGDMRYVQTSLRTRQDDDLAGAMWGLVVLMYQEDNLMFHDNNYTVFAPEYNQIKTEQAGPVNEKYSEVEDLKYQLKTAREDIFKLNEIIKELKRTPPGLDLGTFDATDIMNKRHVKQNKKRAKKRTRR